MMEDTEEPPLTPFRFNNTTPSNNSWIMSSFSVPSFSFRSFVIRQLKAAATGLLINFFIASLLVNSKDENFKPSSLNKALVVLGLIFMLLAVIFGVLRKLKKDGHCHNCDTSSGMDTVAPSDGINPTAYGPEISNDYSVFTSFRFPLHESLHPNQQRVMSIEKADDKGTDTAEVATMASLSFWSKPLISSSLSETSPSPPPPSDQLQWLTSAPPSPLSPNVHQWLPSALPSHLPPRYHSSLPASEPATLQPALLLLEPKFHRQEADSRLACSLAPILNKRGVQKTTHCHMSRNHTSNMTPQASAPQLGLWASQFMEEANFDKFKSDFAKFRNANSSLHDSSKDIARNEAICNNGGSTKSEANERKKSPLLLGKYNQLRNPAHVQPVAEPNSERKIIYKSKGKKSGCLRRLISLFCTQIMRRKRERQQTSRRFNKIPNAPLLSSIHPFVATTSSISTTITSSMPRGRNSFNQILWSSPDTASPATKTKTASTATTIVHAARSISDMEEEIYYDAEAPQDFDDEIRPALDPSRSPPPPPHETRRQFVTNAMPPPPSPYARLWAPSAPPLPPAPPSATRGDMMYQGRVGYMKKIISAIRNWIVRPNKKRGPDNTNWLNQISSKRFVSSTCCL